MTISAVAQNRLSPYTTSELGTVYNVVVQLPDADLYFEMKKIQQEIAQHNWTIAGKTTLEVSKLKTWLSKHEGTGLVVTRVMLKDQVNADHPSIKLLSEYISGLLLQRFQYGRVYKRNSKTQGSQPIEFSQFVISEAPAITRYRFYFKGDPKPFLITQGIGSPSDSEYAVVTEQEQVRVESSIAGSAIDEGEEKKFILVSSFDYKPTMVGHSMAGITGHGDTVLYAWKQRPRFKGGDEKLEEFLNSRVKFPDSAVDSGIFGAVVEVAATFMKDGSVCDLVIADGDPRFHAECLRILKESSGMWIPGIGPENNKNCNVRCTVEVFLKRSSR